MSQTFFPNLRLSLSAFYAAMGEFFSLSVIIQRVVFLTLAALPLLTVGNVSFGISPFIIIFVFTSASSIITSVSWLRGG